MSVIFCEKLYDKEFFLKSWAVFHLFKKTSNFIKPECASPCTQNAPTGPAFMSVPFLLRFRSRDSVVGLVTRLWTEWSGVRFLAGELDAEDFFPGAKTAGAWSWLLLSMFRLIECLCTSSPLVYLYGTHRGDFATPLCPLAVSYPFALICCTSYLPLGVSLSCMLHVRPSQCGWFNLPKSIRHKFRNSSLCSFQFWFLFWNECLWCQFLVRGCTISVDFSLFCKYR